MKLLLDTCTFIWLCAEPKNLSPTAKRLLKDESNTRHLSEVSIMEICFKHLSGKLELPSTPALWVEQQIENWELVVVPLSRATVYRSIELPLHHRDPFDRLLIATALEQRASLLSPDRAFHQYPVARSW
jgi:PIN domain nuclease of toxin-antitoxin system